MCVKLLNYVQVKKESLYSESLINRKVVIDMNQIRLIEVNFGDEKKDYRIEIGENIGGRLVQFVKESIVCEKIMVITDMTVKALYLKHFLVMLENLGVDVHYFVINPGESSKSLESANEIYSALAKESFSRSDLIIALGGGVVGDLAGYVAATYKRGIPFIQVPTTLLSQVDSSVGGKVAVNIKEGKNLVGAFYQPKYVLIDTKYLETLKDDQWLDGLGEIIKYAFIGEESLYEYLRKNNLESIKSEIANVIESCCMIKRNVVLEDEFDTGLRMTLNFGHTLGHAIEKYYGYGAYSHGQAVAMGMFLIMRQYEHYESLAFSLSKSIMELLNQYGLYKEEIIEEYSQYCLDIVNDKKVINGQINIIVVDKIGKARSYPLSIQQAKEFLMKEE